MTKPRLSVTRELFGILGSYKEASSDQSWWNRFFEAHAIDAFMDKYATTEENLVLRMSEMYQFDRRGYIIAPSLTKAILPLLDTIDTSVREYGADTVWNDRGVMRGYFLDGDREKRWELWSNVEL